MLQSLAIQKLHGDKLLVAFTANFVNGADVGMIESGGSLRFALETRQRLRIAGYVARKKPQCYEAPQRGVFCLVHHAHAADPQFFQNAIMRNLFDGTVLRASGTIDVPLPHGQRLANNSDLPRLSVSTPRDV